MTATYALNAYLKFPFIRRAQRADLPAIRDLHARSLRALGAPHYGARLIELFLENVGTLDEALVDDGTYWVADSQGRVVGSCGWSERPPRHAASVETPVAARRVRARIHGAYVHPDFVRNGIGRCLMAATEGAVHGRGYPAVALDSALCGVALGEAMGYRRLAPLRARLPGGEHLELVHMRKELVRTPRARAA